MFCNLNFQNVTKKSIFHICKYKCLVKCCWPWTQMLISLIIFSYLDHCFFTKIAWASSSLAARENHTIYAMTIGPGGATVYMIWQSALKGQLNSEWIDEVIVSPKMPTNNFLDFCPGSLLVGRAEIWKFFGCNFGRNDDLINSLWI